MTMLVTILATMALQTAAASPQDADQPDPARTVRIALAPDGRTCAVTWRGAPIDHVALGKAVAALDDKTSPIAVVGDGNTPFRCVGAVVYTLQAAGVRNVGFMQRVAPEAAEPARP